MIKNSFKSIAPLLAMLVAWTAQADVRNLNPEWKFSKPAGKNFPLAAAADSMKKNGKPFYAPDYDDSAWQTVSVPHPVNATDSFDGQAVDAGEKDMYRGFMFYRKHFRLPADGAGKKVFVEFENVRQTLFVYINGEFAGYYEAGIAPAGFDLSRWIKPGDNLLAVATDNTSSRGMNAYAKETIPGHTPGDQSGYYFQWNCKDFNTIQGGLTGNVNLYVKSPVYLTLPLYNNLKTTGIYITASEFDFPRNAAAIQVAAEVRNESRAARKLTLAVEVIDAASGKTVGKFDSANAPRQVPPASDSGKVFPTALESDVYAKEPKPTAIRPPEVAKLTARSTVSGLRFWSPDRPSLYRVRISLRDANSGETVDFQEIVTGFREVRFDMAAGGILLNGKPFYFKGYAQRSTNEWAVIGIANDWLNDFDMALVRESGANFIRWMHVAPKPATIRSGDKYGVVSVAPAGDKEADAKGRSWNQRVEAMRDTMLYFRNAPSILFWEAGNNAITAEHMREMKELKDLLDPDNGRMIGCRTITSPDQLRHAEWVGTMIYRHDAAAQKSMNQLKRQLPMVETEYKRDESPRRVWDDFSPPDYDYTNKWLGQGGRKADGYDIWDQTQEEFCRFSASVKDGYGYFYGNRIGGASQHYYAAAAMMVWSDSNMHGRNSASENCRVSGRVDAVRIPKESFYALQVYQAEAPKVKILGHWNYPPLNDQNYLYHEKKWNGKFWETTGTRKQRDPKNKTVYVLGSLHCAEIELFINGQSVAKSRTPKDLFVYEFPKIDVTRSGEIRAVAKDAKGQIIAEDKLETVGAPASIRLTPVTGPEGLRADGSDVMFFDVAVLDAKGRVCPLADNRITFELKGPGVFLGGYNSGKMDDASVIGKNYVFAECGLNRVFIRSANRAGTLELTAQSDSMKTVATLDSKPVDTTDGFAPRQQEYPAAARDYSVKTDVPAIRDLGRNAAAVDVYKIVLNGKEIAFGRGSMAYKPDTATGVVCPLRPVLAALQKAGAEFQMKYYKKGKMPQYLRDFSFPLLIVTAGSTKVEAVNGETVLHVNSGKEKNLTNFQFALLHDELEGELSAILAYIPGVEMKTDPETKTVTITTGK